MRGKLVVELLGALLLVGCSAAQEKPEDGLSIHGIHISVESWEFDENGTVSISFELRNTDEHALTGADVTL